MLRHPPRQTTTTPVTIPLRRSIASRFRPAGRIRLNRYWKWASAGAAMLMLVTLAVTVLPHVHLAQAAGPSYCPNTGTVTDCITTTSGSGIYLSSSGTLFASQAAQLGLTVTTDNANCVTVTAATTPPTPLHNNNVSKSFTFTVFPGSGNGIAALNASTYRDGSGNNNCATLVGVTTPPALYTLDNAGPTVTPSVSPTPNGAGWDKANVTVTLAVSDGGSGVKSTTYTLNGGSSQTYSSGISVTTEGTNTVNYTATDNVGNVTTGTITIKLDKTIPTITGTRSPGPNGAGWNNSSVTVSYTCADPNGSNGTTGSGVASCSGPTSVTSQGFGQSVTGTATDTAGNSASATVSGINIDETPPTLTGNVITASSGTDASSNVWYNGPVTIQWACADPTLPGGHAGSGVVSCPGNKTMSSEGKNQTASASIADNAGNTTTASSPLVNIDTHAPITSIVSPLSIPNWTNHTLTLTLQASDNLSGVSTTLYTIDGGALQSGTAIAIAGEGSHTVQFWSEDYAGNFEPPHTVTVNIDETAPTITHTQTPLANGAGWNNGDVTVTFTCADPANASNGTPGSGVATCDGIAGATGSTADSTEGTTSVTGNAVDNAGNTASDTDTVNLDKTDPTINGTTDRAANAHGWYNAPVTITFTCADPANASNGTPGSGIASGGCTTPSTLSSDGANQHANGSATDVAGNTASTTVSGINIDQTAPTLSGAATTTANGNGWYKAPVTIHWSCSDALSGIDGSCPTDSTITGEGANLTASTSTSDLAGNTTTASSPAVNIDQTAPVTTVAHLTSANYISSGGTLWYRGDVSLDLSATDNLSGIAATYMSVDGSPAVAATSATVSGQGSHTVIFWSVDKAGNVEDRTAAGHSISFNIDLTPPTISGARAPIANGNGWNNGPVTVTFSCADGESGLASCTNPVTLSSEGFNQQATGTAADNAGNTSNVTVGSINIDETAPTLTGTPAAPPNGAGWYNGNVIIQWSCADPTLADGNPGSGVASCPANSTITGEGHGLTASASASDKAGNTGSANSAAVNIDRTAPDITGAITTASSGTDALSNLWYNTDVTVAWTCSDPTLADGSGGSGVASCPANSTITGEGAGLTTSTTVADKAGNIAIGTSPAANIDRTPPNTIVTAPSGWNNTDVTVTFNANDVLSGVKATHFSLDGGADQTGSSLTISNEGDHTLTFYSEDYAGNKETAKTVHVLIDKTAPTISDTHSPLPNSAGWNNTDVTVTFTCADALSGVATCDGIAGTTGSTTITSEGKDQAVTGTAVDNAGNTATDPATVSIDTTKPTIHGATDRAANADNWYDAPVTVTFTCADPNGANNTPGSGIANCDPPVILSSDGRNESASGSATDAAGNSASTSVSGINLDQVAPTVNGAPTTPANSAGWYNGDVTIQWTCSDAKLADGSDGSGVVSCPGNSSISGEGTNLGASASASDHAGNTGTGMVNGIHIDRTAPVTTASAPTADYINGAGVDYYGAAVKLDLTSTDNLSGIAHTYYTLDGGAQQSYSAAFTISSEGTHTLTFWSVDNAGNIEDKTAPANTMTFRIDLTAPAINTNRTPANGHGWNNGPVTVTFSCVDPALSDSSPSSGVASCSSPVTLTGEGAGQSVTGAAADNVGNTSTAPVSNINIDLTKPSLAGAPTTTPNGFGWYNSDVVIHWTATDALSGVDPATSPADSTLTGEGAGLKAHASVSDLAGNTSSADSMPVNIDRTAPTLAGSISVPTRPSGTDNHGTPWYNTDVAVGWTACDALSGVDPASVPGSNTLNGSCYLWTDTVTGEGANQSSNETASDKAGNPASNAVAGIHIDRTPPATTLSAAPPDWSTSDVTLTLSATDNLSGVQTTFYTIDGSGQQTGTTLQVNGEGTHTVQFWSVDYAGNMEATHTVTVKIDKTAPAITHTQSPLANDAGWNNSDVTVTFTCSDPNLSDGTAGSGVKTCDGVAGTTGATAVMNEGPNQAVTGTAVDNAGNTASDTATINLDKTKPAISGAPDRPANAHGWYNADVTVTFTCNDPNGGNGTAGSGIANCPAPTTLGEGASQSVSGSTTDYAGNSASTAVSGINIDKTAPTLSGAIITTPSGTDAHGNVWYNTDVTVHWSCSDALSGIDGTCPADSTVGPSGGQGTNLSATQTVSDLAGNTSPAMVGGINIDRVAPATAAALQTSAPTFGTWYGGKVMVTLSATDNLSGVAKTYYTVDGGTAQLYSAAFAVDGDGSHTITFWSRDYAGNVEAARSQKIQIDEAAPTIAGAATTSPNGNGWYNSAVTVKFTCADGESGLVSCDGASSSPGMTSLATDGANQSVTGAAYDNVGHSASATVSGLNVDRTLPSVTVTIGSTSFTDGGGSNTGPTIFTHTIANPYTLGNSPSLGCTATDATSGFGGTGNTCVGVLTGGMSNGVGAFTYTATATDLAGNTTKVVVTFVVAYNFSGFLQPINYTAHQIGASSSTFKGGSTVPVKFQLRLANGTVIQAGTLPLWVDPVNAGSNTSSPSASAGSAPVTTTNGGTFRWDTTGQQYIYNWNTAGTQAGNWWRAGVQLDDGQTYFVYINLRA